MQMWGGRATRYTRKVEGRVHKSSGSHGQCGQQGVQLQQLMAAAAEMAQKPGGWATACPGAAPWHARTSERGSRLNAWKPKWRPTRCTTWVDEEGINSPV